MSHSIASIEEIDEAQFPVLEELSGLALLEHDIESSFRLAFLTGQASELEKYELLLRSIEQKIPVFNQSLRKVGANTLVLDRKRLSAIENHFIQKNRQRLNQGASNSWLRALPSEIEEAATEFKAELYKVTNVASRARESFLSNKKAEFRRARNWGMGLTALIILSLISFVLTYQHVVRARQELEAKALNSSKLASLGEMAGGIAHEINNPLAIVTGYNELSLVGLKKGRPEDIEKVIHRMQRSQKALERITDVIQSLKAFSRDGSNDPKRPIQLKELVSNSISLCAEHVSNKHIKVKMDVDNQLYINANKTELSQVIINLLSNSIYAVQQQEVPWIRIEGEREGKQIRLSVVDSGSGIPEEIVEDLIKPFFTTKPVGEGTGLGLSISHGIIKDHNGSMNYDSGSPNTKFDMFFPDELGDDFSSVGAKEEVA